MPDDGARAGQYERVSTGIADAELSRSIERQNQEGRRATEQNGWRVVGRYSDPAVSASRFARKDRPEWARLLADVTAGRIDVIVMWEVSRGSRRAGEWMSFLDLCRERGVRVYITQDRRVYDLSLTSDWKDMASAGVDSAHESNKTSDRTRDGVVDSVARGDPYGRVPYGYMRRYELDPTPGHPGAAPRARTGGHGDHNQDRGCRAHLCGDPRPGSTEDPEPYREATLGRRYYRPAGPGGRCLYREAQAQRWPAPAW
jgi:DNA invertase Pin-like site-specific DNA recombinase